MDGHFVPNITFGPSVIKAVKDYAPHLFRDVHLMLAHPEKYVEVENKLGVLEPGDIRISNGHVEMYVEINGQPYIASASNCDRTGEIGDFYENSGTFRAYRFKK